LTFEAAGEGNNFSATLLERGVAGGVHIDMHTTAALSCGTHAKLKQHDYETSGATKKEERAERVKTLNH
jgi:hypothetical protein